MAVGGLGWDAAKKGPELLVITNGTLDQINNDFRHTKDLVGFFTVNISDIVRRLRAKAQAAGIDLSRPFFFPPDDPQFNQILSQIRRERDARIARLRRDKKKFAAAKARGRGENITELPRVRDLNYPTVMREIFTATSSAR
jgi:lysophospholipase L1-like esterase